ncbi:beta-ketoacyl-ACP synthase III [Helicobacter himalayensis]|uniref:beta-ketoacyl-ACP synthase III n=1 Tax=Helicobacter himalayensis TaxID=1591088 RepID=UPI000835BF9E|nr:beta-ketoacyl-ACP synthase III [Helicobacter himalayensis]
MSKKIFASLISIASYVPKNCVSNVEFEKHLDTSDEWIRKRTGIQTRYFADSAQYTSDLAYEAGKIALKRANIEPSAIDAVIVATLSPDYLTMPSTACLVSAKLGIEGKTAFDISSACSGFIYLLGIAKSFIESGAYKNVLIIGAEKLSSVIDFNDRSTCVLFGDGAGAAVISATDNPKKAIVDVHLGANGNYSDFLLTPRTQAFNPYVESDAKANAQDSHLQDSNANPLQCIQMKGNETFKLAVKTLSDDVKRILKANNLSSKDISFFIPHQANLRIINAVGASLEFEEEQIIITVQKYGNTSAASIPMAIDETYKQGRLKNGDLLLLDAFGGGLTWGSVLVYFNGA